ncbi:MAG: TetR/AcrR family transcriptional regulator [Beijerinckiaceae bacterium]|nr:TetR/AcrR family transcriptional regulator [Beijerinckiaceae bacterium]MCZ8300664.1 TetR/AcrR family transcriptional regulator [Beijerinckiaceae bacterium]
MSSAGMVESVRNRLIAAAATEIRQIGPRRMTISGIAGRLGMSHANVYRYFADKGALVEAVLNGWLRIIEQRLQDIVDGPDPADDKLERFLSTLARAYSEATHQDPAIFHLLAEPEFAPAEAERHRKRVEGLVERVIEEGNVTRLFSGGDSRRMAVLALDLGCRFCDPGMVWLGKADSVGSEARRDRVVRWVVRAMSGRK